MINVVFFGYVAIYVIATVQFKISDWNMDWRRELDAGAVSHPIDPLPPVNC